MLIPLTSVQLWTVPVYDNDGQELSPEQLMDQLVTVTESQGGEEGAEPLGLLTTMTRDRWAHIYDELMQDENNRDALLQIQRSLFVLCLDRPVPSDPDPHPLPTSPILTATHLPGHVYRMFSGGGVDFNSANRWCDKPLQMVVGASGSWGHFMNNTVYDATHTIYVQDYISQYLEQTGFDGGKPGSPVRPSNAAGPTRLQLNLLPQASTALREARHRVNSFVNNMDLSSFTVRGLGKKMLKKCGMSTDAFIQIALQLAYYRLHGRPAYAVEFVSKRHYRLGRYDEMLCVTSESLRFLSQMDSSDVSAEDKLQGLRKALEAHTAQTKQIQAESTMNIHLMALQDVAKEQGYEAPPLFQDPSFQMVVSRSQLNVTSNQTPFRGDMGAYYNVQSEDGHAYAIPYTPHEDYINFNVCVNCQVMGPDSAQRMSHSLVTALSDMGQLALQAQKHEAV